MPRNKKQQRAGADNDCLILEPRKPGNRRKRKSAGCDTNIQVLQPGGIRSNASTALNGTQQSAKIYITGKRRVQQQNTQTLGSNLGTLADASHQADDLETSDLILQCDNTKDITSLQSFPQDSESSKENMTDNIHRNEARSESNSESLDHKMKEDDDEFDQAVIPLAGFDPTLTFSDSDSDDIYSVNHNAIKASAQEAAVKGLYEAQKLQQHEQYRKQEQQEQAESMRQSSVSRSHHPVHQVDSDPEDRAEEISSSPDLDSIKLSARKMCKMSKKTEQLLKKAELLQKNMKLDFDQSFNRTLDGDVELLAVTDEELNPTILMNVKTGLTFTKLAIKKHEKFGIAYQCLAEMHKVPFDHVVLNLRDTLLSPDQTPAQVQLSIADIVECGIIRTKGSKGDKECAADDALHSSTSAASCSGDPNTIQLKLQCSALRGAIYLSINKFEKMSGIMQRYADNKEEPLSKFKFIFDGEKLDPEATPNSLDLEGGECIDVYPM